MPSPTTGSSSISRPSLLSQPSRLTEEEKPAEATPGMACTFRRIS